MKELYSNESEIEEVVRSFEACRTDKGDFKHRSHLTVAVYYMHRSKEADATERMRSALLLFLDHQGVGREKYHETVTVFWIRMIRTVLDELDSNLSLREVTNAVLESLGNPRLVFEYYSEELLQSNEAKKNWVEPDLKPIER